MEDGTPTAPRLQKKALDALCVAFESLVFGEVCIERTLLL